MKTKYFLIMMVVITFLLSGCIDIQVVSEDIDLRLLSDGKWELKDELVIVGDSLQYVKGVLQYLIDEYSSLSDEYGVEADWGIQQMTDDTFLFIMNMDGASYDSLEIFFDDSVVYPDPTNDNRLIFSAEYWGNGSETNTFTLHGAGVIETNGVRDGMNKVVWTDFDGEMVALIRKPGSVTWIFVLISVVVIAVIAIIFVQKSRKNAMKKPAYQMVVSPQNRACPHCGNSLSDEAPFCPRCGKPIR